MMSKSSIIRKLHKDNGGSGLVMVLIMVAFLGILTGILMFTTYIGYQMRLVDKQGKDNFYTAEAVLDEINIGIQTEISDALADAYKKVMENYSIYETPEARNDKLREIYYNNLWASLRQSDSEGTRYNIDKLRGYISSELLGDGDASLDNFGTYGAIVESNIGGDVYPLIVDPDGKGLILQDLKITYVNRNGFVSIITTDMRIALPAINFAESSSAPDLNKYCVIADNGLKAGNTVNIGSIEFAGDVYAKSMKLGAQNGSDYTGNDYLFVGDTDISFKASPAETGVSEPHNGTVVTKENIELYNTTLTTTSVDLWSGNVILESAEADLNGNTYLQNDLRLEGTDSEVKLSGTYTGFGTADDSSVKSSAIVVNGRNSSLDLSNLSSINISGHSFISTSDASFGVANVHDASDRSADVLMGESVAVKSNQLIYLIPPEALGCEILADGTVGDSVYRSNPMKITQYQELKNNPDKYVLVDANRQIDALGGHKLSEYMDQQKVAGQAAAYRPIVVVKQTNAGSICYCYMQFSDSEAANRYFRDYYNINSENVDKYTRIYADAIKMPDNLSDLVYIHLAGNMFTYEENSFDVIGATDSLSETKRAELLSVVRGDMFTALTSKMVTNISQLSIEEQGRSVYNNIIDGNVLNTLVSALKPSATATAAIVYTEDGAGASILSTGNVTIDDYTDDKVKLVVCSGDVRIKRDFEGTVISGGEVIIGDEADVDKHVKLSSLNVEEFTQLLQAKEEKDGIQYYVLDVFRDGKNYAENTVTYAGEETSEVNLADLITYERWSKQ